MRKILSAIICMFILGSSGDVLAMANNELSENEYLYCVSEIMNDYYDDERIAAERLSKLDTELVGQPAIQSISSNNDISMNNQITPMKTSPSDYEISTYSFKRAGSTITYLQTLIKANKSEWFYGPLDYVSIEWDAKKASYYGSSGDGIMSTVQGKNTGIVLFNIEDKKLDKGKSTYVTVQVNNIKKGTSLDYGSKFVHTYTSLGVSGSATYSIQPSAKIGSLGDISLGVTGNYGFTVNVSSKTTKRQVWSDNTLYY